MNINFYQVIELKWQITPIKDEYFKTNDSNPSLNNFFIKLYLVPKGRFRQNIYQYLYICV